VIKVKFFSNFLVALRHAGYKEDCLYSVFLIRIGLTKGRDRFILGAEEIGTKNVAA
jgi:hypothetical protein